MKLNRNLLKCMVFLAAILIPVTFALRLYAYWFDLDVATGFFRTNSIACNTANGIGLLFFALCLLLAAIKKDLPSTEKKAKLAEEDAAVFHELYDEAFSLPKEENLILEDINEDIFEENPLQLPLLEGYAKKVSMWTGTFSAFASFLPGFGFAAYAVAFFLQNKGAENTFFYLHAFLSLISAAFFLVFSLRNSPEKNKFIPFFALAPAFWCTMRMVIEYRDLTRFMNKTLYVGQFLFVICALIFFLYQAELLLGEKNFSNPNFYAFFAASTLFFGLSARLSHLIAGLGGMVSIDLIDATSLLIDLAITLFVAAKLSAFLKKDGK